MPMEAASRRKPMEAMKVKKKTQALNEIRFGCRDPIESSRNSNQKFLGVGFEIDAYGGQKSGGRP